MWCEAAGGAGAAGIRVVPATLLLLVLLDAVLPAVALVGSVTLARVLPVGLHLVLDMWPTWLARKGAHYATHWLVVCIVWVWVWGTICAANCAAALGALADGCQQLFAWAVVAAALAGCMWQVFGYDSGSILGQK